MGDVPLRPSTNEIFGNLDEIIHESSSSDTEDDSFQRIGFFNNDGDETLVGEMVEVEKVEEEEDEGDGEGDGEGDEEGEDGEEDEGNDGEDEGEEVIERKV